MEVEITESNRINPIQEERFTRNKHTREFPENAIAECLRIDDTFNNANEPNIELLSITYRMQLVRFLIPFMKMTPLSPLMVQANEHVHGWGEERQQCIRFGHII